MLQNYKDILIELPIVMLIVGSEIKYKIEPTAIQIIMYNSLDAKSTDILNFFLYIYLLVA